MGKLDPNRPINRHGRVKKNNKFKSYRLESTPIVNSLATLVVLWVFVPLWDLDLVYRDGESFFSAYLSVCKRYYIEEVVLSLALSTLVPIGYFYMWLKFKAEDYDR